MSYVLVSRIPKIIQHANQTVAEVNEKTAKELAADAAARAPKGATGELSGSIEAQHVDGDDWAVTVGVWYARFVEFGTVHAGARPFLTPAAEGQRDAHKQALRDVYR